MTTEAAVNNNDFSFIIHEAPSRFAKKWLQKVVKWSAFCAKLSVPRVTSETVAEYQAKTKAERDAIKDVGGYVGGRIKDGRRTKGNIESRSLVVLDADYAGEDFLSMVQEKLAESAWFAHTTRSHTPTAPRWRLIIPLAREVMPDEYVALSRQVANLIGIDRFDDTTYDPNRLMYWPSRSCDGSFDTNSRGAQLLNPDEILANYPNGDWRDTAAWPYSSRVTADQKHNGATMENPLEKTGLIGAFCRAYSIPAAIETFLDDVYVNCGANRYTYKGGSTFGGFVVYDELYGYSHHGTDPVNGRTVNAFDLVRLHKFGDMDVDCSEDALVTQLPSYTEMCNLVSADPLAGEQLERDRQQRISQSLGEEFTTDTDLSWASELKRKNNGDPQPSGRNIEIILEHDCRLKDKFGHNTFSGRSEISGDLPWRPPGDYKSRDGMFWTDTDDASLRTYIEHHYGISNAGKVDDALKAIMQKKRFNPVLDEIDALQWDGVPRLDTMLIDYLGAEDSPYTRAVTRKTMIAMIRRVRRPGCKFDYVLTLKGPQGVGKSTLLKTLGGSFFSDSVSVFIGKEAVEQLLGFMLLEVAELAALKRSEADTAKQFLSKQEDAIRLAYERRPTIFPRRCIFVATTNEDNFLKDQTGNRRFWVVPVNVQKPTLSIWNDLPGKNRDLLLAEAAFYEQQGEAIFLDAETERLAKAMQEVHREASPLEDTIRNFLDMPLPPDWDTKTIEERRIYIQDAQNLTKDGTLRQRVCAMEIWRELLGQETAKLSSQRAKEIKACILNTPGWEPYGTKQRCGIHSTQRAFKRVGSTQPDS